MTDKTNSNMLSKECVDCKVKCVKQGRHVTRKGIRQRYKCPSCGRFYLEDKFDILFVPKED